MALHHSRIVQRLPRLLFPLAVLTILAAGGFAGWLRAQGMDQRLRRDLLTDARAVAQAVCPTQAGSLALAPSDVHAPHYRRLGQQLTAYARASGQSVYTILQADDHLAMGPGGAADAAANLPTAANLSPQSAATVRAVHRSHQATVVGPYAAAHGTLVSALVPVCDPRRGGVLITVGMDRDGGAWRVEVWRAALAPILIALAGVLALAAGNLAARHRRRLPADQQGASRCVETLAVAVGGLILTLTALALVTDIQTRDWESGFRRMADAHAASVAGALQDIQQYELPTLARFFEASEEVTWREFRALVAPLAASSMIRAWEWVPRVPHEGRAPHEQQAVREGLPAYRLIELAADGTRVPAAARDAYYPVLYAVPLEGNESVLGYDLGSEPVRRAALEEAARAGLATATDVVDLLQEGGGRALLIVHPVHASGGEYPPAPSVDAPPHQLAGYVLAVLPLDVILREAVPSPEHEETYVSLALLQLHCDAPPTVLASSDPQHLPGQPLLLPVSGPDRPTATYPLFAFGRAYVLVARPGPALANAGTVWTRWAILLTGALLTALACGVAAMAKGHQWRLEREVRRSTAELSESEARYRTFIDATSDLVFVKDDEFRYVVVNKAQAGFFGKRPEEVIGRTDYDFMPPDAADGCRASDRAAIEAGSAVVSEEVLAGRVYELVKFPVPLQDGKTGVGGFVRDITERQRAREELARNEARLRSLLSIFQRHAESVQDLLDHALEEALQLTGSKLGYIGHYKEDRQEFVMNTWSRQAARACAIREPQTVYRLEETGLWGEAVRQGRPIVVNDFRAPHPLKRGYPEGHVPLHRFLTVPVIHDGHIVAVVGVANKEGDYDQTDVLQLTLLLDGVWRGVEAWGSQERIRHLNQVLRAIRDVNRLIARAETPHQLMAETCAILVEARGYLGAMALLTADDGQPLTVVEAGLGAPFRPVLEGARQGALPPPCLAAAQARGVHVVPDRREACAACPAEAHCATMDAVCTRLEYGEERFGYLTIWVQRGQGADAEEHDLIAGMAADLAFALHNMALEAAKAKADAERKSLEAQLAQAQKMEAVGRLAGGVAHDFNNMLSVISGYTDLAKLSIPPDDPAHEDLEEIRKAAAKSADLTRQLLTFARQQTIRPRVIDLNETIADSERMLRRLVGEDVTLSLKREPGLWPVQIDPTQVSQILANLAANARDAISGVGSVTIETANATLDEAWCRSRVGSRPGDYVVMAFSDSGVGMSREVQEHLFEPFFTTKEAGKGTGLGLSTVYGIIQQNAGFIHVYSEVGQGTTLRIYLPRVSEPAEEAREESRAPSARGTETILLVEDERQIVDLCRRLLEGQGYTVLAAQRPEEALTLCAQHPGPIHLLISDVVMPGMNGRELAERVGAVKPEIKVLYMSGYTTGAIASRGVIDTRVNYIQKPFDMSDFADKVRQVLDEP